MAVEATPLLLTTQGEVESIFSSLAVQLRLDDDDDLVPTTQYMTDAIIEASDTAYEYLLHYYDGSVLETSTWVRRRVAYIAAHILSRRCGNPAQYSDEYDKAISDFERIRNGLWFIPRMSTKDDFTPTVSNQVVDYRYSRAKLRTDPVTSGDLGQGRPIDWWDYYVDYVY
jgi:hypothetical protein